MRRGRILRRQNRKRAVGLLSASASFVAAALIIAIGWFGGAAAGAGSGSAYGAFLLPVEAGGYILAAVIAFAVGVGVTVWILKYRNDHEK